MGSDHLRHVGDGVRLLGVIGLHLELRQRGKKKQTSRDWCTCLSIISEGKVCKEGAYLLSGAVWLVQIDSHLTVPSTECVHCEHGRAEHPVARRFDTCTQTGSRWQYKLGNVVHSFSRFSSSPLGTCQIFKISCLRRSEQQR